MIRLTLYAWQVSNMPEGNCVIAEERVFDITCLLNPTRKDYMIHHDKAWFRIVST